MADHLPRPATGDAFRILTVCLGNHCRSPFAAALLGKLLAPAVTVRSAGIRDKHVGKPAHPLMTAVAAQRGYDLSDHRGRQIDQELLAWAHLVLAMDHHNLAILQAMVDTARFVGRTMPRLHLYLDNGDDVPDPWGGTRADFATCATIIEAGAAHYLPLRLPGRSAGGAPPDAPRRTPPR